MPSGGAEDVELPPILRRHDGLPRPESRQEPRHLANAPIVREQQVAIGPDGDHPHLPDPRRRRRASVARPSRRIAVADPDARPDGRRDDPRRCDTPNSKQRKIDRCRSLGDV